MRRLVVALLLLAASCGKDEAPAWRAAYTCDLSAVAGQWSCTRHPGQTPMNMSFLQTDCTGHGGTWSDPAVACPAAGLVASCTRVVVGANERYLYAGFALLAAEHDACGRVGGSWTSYP
jgi:hypothetical protein